MKKEITFGAIAAAIALAVIGLFTCIEKVPVGYMGMVYSPKGLEEVPLNQGWHLVAPWKKVTHYNISLEQAFLSRNGKEGGKDDDSFTIPSKEGKQVNVDFAFSYSFDENRISNIYKTFRGKSPEIVKDTFMRGKIKVWASEVSSRYPVIEIFGEKRQELNDEVYKHIYANFEEYGIIIDSSAFSRIDVDKNTMEAIQQVVDAKQRLIQLELDIKQQEIQKEIEEMRISKEKVTVEHDNWKREVNAIAIAKSNEIISNSITKELLEMEKVNKWNGKLPVVTGGAMPLMSIEGIGVEE